MTERLQDDLDTFAEERGYTGRSEVIREACQSLLEEYRSQTTRTGGYWRQLLPSSDTTNRRSNAG